VRRSNYLVLFALTLFFGAIIASATPAKAQDEVSLVFRYPTGQDYYSPPSRIPGTFWVTIDIYAPEAWDDTPEGIVGWSFNVHVDPAVLEPVGAYAATFGYYVYDFCDYYGYTANYPSLLVSSVDTTTGDITGISCFIMGWETLGVGAGGTSDPNTGWYGLDYGMARLRYKVNTAEQGLMYSPIEITDARYYTTTSGPDGIPFDSVEYPGHYNPPPVPEFPLGAAFQVGLIVAVAYVWWTRRHKLKEVP
jgi:hypothetical protein